MTENEIGTRVIEAAIAVHRELGPELLETVYEVVLARELTERGLKVVRQAPVPITYKGIRFDEGFRADLIVEDRVILELKSVERVVPAHKKQVQTYLKLTGCKLGYLLNFGEEVMRTGITRCVNGLEEQPLRPCASAGEEKVPTTGCYVAGVPLETTPRTGVNVTRPRRLRGSSTAVSRRL